MDFKIEFHGVAGFIEAEDQGKKSVIRTVYIIYFILAFVGAGFLCYQRVDNYIYSKNHILYATSHAIPRGGLPLPSVTICSESFSSEFAYHDYRVSLPQPCNYE